MSIQVSRSEFESINLKQVDPKACFRKLKGVSAAKLQALAPVAPVAQINREDKPSSIPTMWLRDLDDSLNLASMDWEDFEHLIRELFGKEFASAGARLRLLKRVETEGLMLSHLILTHSGRKIVIQAKRYTNVVGVSAVRDLCGTR